MCALYIYVSVCVSVLHTYGYVCVCRCMCTRMCMGMHIMYTHRSLGKTFHSIISFSLLVSTLTPALRVSACLLMPSTSPPQGL